MTSLADLVARATRLGADGRRVILGITGPPGAGKSTLADAIVRTVPTAAALVPMDGFHLADRELDRLGRRDRKGAPDTFDAAGYVHLLRRLTDRADEVVYAPLFVRKREQAEAGALPIPREIVLVVTEGSYLLSGGAFAPVRKLLTECWYVHADPAVRRDRLVARHTRHGRSLEAARRWIEQTDEPNARLIALSRADADLLVELP